MFNWVDAIIILILSLFAWNGYRKGFILQFGDFIALLFSIALSFTLYGVLANWLSGRYQSFIFQGMFGRVLALAIIWIGTQVIFYLLFGLGYRILPKGVRESKINKGTGVLPGVAWGALFVVVFYSIVVLGLSLFPGYKKYQEDMSNSLTGKLIFAQATKLEDYIAKALGNNFNDTLTFKTVKSSDETYDLGYKLTKVKVSPDAEEQMLELVNKERKDQGLEPLEMDEKLRTLAREQSKDMFARGYFAHKNPDGEDPFDRMADHEITYIIAGENLALAPTVAIAHDGLMNSPGHRENILKEQYRKVGIGVIDGGKYGLMFTQEFTN